ncbi:MAG TPA: hypothetical protein VJO35_06150 [Terriglobales bacterium]|nr:hypothetical protein [Terriglobales bacterium]
MVCHRGRSSCPLLLASMVFVFLPLIATVASAQSVAGSASKTMYWICTVSYYSKPYVSDVIPGDASGAGLQELVKGFRSFVDEKYKLTPPAGGGNCIYQFSEAQAQAYLSRLINSPSGPGAIATHWKPGMQPDGSMTAPPAVPSAASTGPNWYWVCRMDGKEEGSGPFYVSEVTGPFANPENMPAFYHELTTSYYKFVVARYNTSTRVAPYCEHYAAEPEAQLAVKSLRSYPNAVLTGWKYTGAPLATTNNYVTRGPDGQVISALVRGNMTPYYCYLQHVPQGTHRQVTYTTSVFSTVESHDWITFWWSKYMHTTYHIPGRAYIAEVDCRQLSDNPAQQQSTLDRNIVSWKQHNIDVVQLNWVPTEKQPLGQITPPWAEIWNGHFETQ